MQGSPLGERNCAAVYDICLFAFLFVRINGAEFYYDSVAIEWHAQLKSYTYHALVRCDAMGVRAHEQCKW
jgi:hypothetical protein